MSIKAYVLDLKTTNKNPATAQPIEIGLVEVGFKHGNFYIGEPIVERCKPDSYISFGAMASTNITNENVVELDSYSKVMSRIMPLGFNYIISHNIGFNLQVARNAGVDICRYNPISTTALAKNLVPNADDFRLTTLSYMFDYVYIKENSVKPHTAGFDAILCARVLRELCRLGDIFSIEQLFAYSLKLNIPSHFDFGKHKGESILAMEKTPAGREYLKWVVQTVKNNPSMVKACEMALEGTLASVLAQRPAQRDGESWCDEHTDEHTDEYDNEGLSFA